MIKLKDYLKPIYEDKKVEIKLNGTTAYDTIYNGLAQNYKGKDLNVKSVYYCWSLKALVIICTDIKKAQDGK